MKITTTFTHLYVVIWVFSLMSFGFANEELIQEGIVERVVDGDTLLIQGGLKIRLIGVDTPEVHMSAKMDRDAKRSGQDIKTIKSLGKQSSQFVKDRVLGKKVFYTTDASNIRTQHRDKYNRFLAYVYFEMNEAPEEYLQYLKSKNQKFKEGRVMLNALLLQCGYANVYTRFPYEHMEYFRDCERAARENEIGLFGDQNFRPKENSGDKKNPLPLNDLPFVASRKGRVFHKSGCKDADRINMSNLIGFSSSEDAVSSGRKPCLRCQSQ